jgi:hypothetical protein
MPKSRALSSPRQQKVYETYLKGIPKKAEKALEEAYISGLNGKCFKGKKKDEAFPAYLAGRDNKLRGGYHKSN